MWHCHLLSKMNLNMTLAISLKRRQMWVYLASLDSNVILQWVSSIEIVVKWDFILHRLWVMQHYKHFIASHPLTNSGWVTVFLPVLSHFIMSDYEQRVGDTAISVLSHLINSTMANRMWVTLPVFFQAKTFMPLSTGCEWHCLLSCQIFPSCSQQDVSNTALFSPVKCHQFSCHDQQHVSHSVIYFVHAFSFISSHHLQEVSDIALLFSRQSHHFFKSHNQ